MRYASADRNYVTGQSIVSRNRTLSASTGLLDFKVSGLSVFEATYMEGGKEANTVPVLASFSLRPSALNRRLFTTVGAIGPVLITVLLAVGVVFLLIEIAALATGVVMTRTITRAVDDLYEATVRVRRGDFGPRIRVHQRDQLGALGGSFNEMTSSISELIDEQAKRQKLENEIVIAREVQSQICSRRLFLPFPACNWPPFAAPPAWSAATTTISSSPVKIASASPSPISAGREFLPRC